ncbi:unnamed protein product [Linum trigynum]|uniref:Uncharacterized protein n=1 Tax=Linum trigynum TaxID=586398 RepID=A0AAV2CEU1_9ROSI
MASMQAALQQITNQIQHLSGSIARVTKGMLGTTPVAALDQATKMTSPQLTLKAKGAEVSGITGRKCVQGSEKRPIVVGESHSGVVSATRAALGSLAVNGESCGLGGIVAATPTHNHLREACQFPMA